MTDTEEVAMVLADSRRRAESAAPLPLTLALPPDMTNDDPVSELLTICME